MIELVGEQIEIYDEIIAEKQAELDKALEKETTQTELLRSRIRAMEENSTYSYASFIFDSSSVTELLSRIGDVNDIMHYRQNSGRGVHGGGARMLSPSRRATRRPVTSRSSSRRNWTPSRPSWMRRSKRHTP